MAGKTIESRAPVSIESLAKIVAKKYESVFLELPDYLDEGGKPIRVEVARLKRHERAAIQQESRLPGGLIDVEVQNRMAAAFGLVNPRISSEELKEYPDGFIEQVADKVWEISNDYRTRDAEKGNGTGPAPFTKRSSAPTASASPTAGPSET